jgi:GntR family transcriptional regulator, rspAB operon transcriptional repressor
VEISLRLADNEDTGRLSDSVYETLLAAILAGQLLPGSVVSEVALARQLNVSRTPVHDALRQLAKDGLLKQRANHRAVVAQFSREDVFDIFEMRKLLEGEAARLAATHIDRPTLGHLRSLADLLNKSRRERNWVSRWADFDDEFHDTIAKASGRLRLWQDIARYRMLHRGFNKLTTTRDVLQQAMEEHYRILDALAERDAEVARQAMIVHIQEWQAYFINHLNP